MASLDAVVSVDNANAHLPEPLGLKRYCFCLMPLNGAGLVRPPLFTIALSWLEEKRYGLERLKSSSKRLVQALSIRRLGS